MSIISNRVNTDREQLAYDVCEEHAQRIVICTPSKIVFEMKSDGDATLAQAKLNGHGFSTKLFDGRFLHARF